MVLVKYRATVKVHRSFLQNSFQCDGARWQLPANVVPACRVAMDTYLLCLKHSQPVRNQFPSSSIIGRELSKQNSNLIVYAIRIDKYM